ncbi:hypothetical protein D3C74_343930 [compost metagenome]
MFSTAIVTPVAALSSRTWSANPRAYKPCQRNGGWTTTVPAPSSSARSTVRSSLGPGSRPHTRWLTRSVGACTLRIGTPTSAESLASALASWVVESDQTMTSMPSYPRCAAASNANGALRGYTLALDSVTLIRGSSPVLGSPSPGSPVTGGWASGVVASRMSATLAPTDVRRSQVVRRGPRTLAGCCSTEPHGAQE